MTALQLRAVFVDALQRLVLTMLANCSAEWVAVQLRDAADVVEVRSREAGRWSDATANTLYFGGEEIN